MLIIEFGLASMGLASLAEMIEQTAELAEMIERLMSALMIFMHVLALKWMLPIAVCFFYPSVG